MNGTSFQSLVSNEILAFQTYGIGWVQFLKYPTPKWKMEK